MQPMLIIFAMIASIAAGNSATHVTDVSVLSSPVSQHSAQTAMAFEDLGPAIQLVVLACKRPLALNALLTNLHSVGESGGYEGHSVPLLISIDVPRGKLAPPADVVGLANGFGWAHGEKTVKVQAQHQGIIGQWLNLRTTASNPWMAVLEDDLALSPCFYSYLLRGTARHSLTRGFVGCGSSFLPVALHSSPGVWPPGGRRWFHAAEARTMPYRGRLLRSS